MEGGIEDAVNRHGSDKISLGTFTNQSIIRAIDVMERADRLGLVVEWSCYSIDIVNSADQGEQVATVSDLDDLELFIEGFELCRSL